MQSDIFQLENGIEWLPAGEGVKRQIMGFGDDLMLVKVKFETGARGVLHHHPHLQASYVESGVFELTIGEEVQILRKGDGYFVPANSVHGCLCVEEGVLIDAFSPAREDFLSGEAR